MSRLRQTGYVWDIQRGGGEDKCISKGMYENADCLATYESQLTEMSSNILQAFGSNKKAAMFRTSNCCGGTSSRDTRDAVPGDLDAAGPALEAVGAAVSALLHTTSRAPSARAPISDPDAAVASPPILLSSPLKPPTKKLSVRNF